MEREKVLGLPVVTSLARGQAVSAADLQVFKAELLVAIKNLLSQHFEAKPKKWLKSYEVKKVLGISSGTLQTLRNTGKIPFSKIGGTIYYNMDEVNKSIESYKKDLNRKAQHG